MSLWRFLLLAPLLALPSRLVAADRTPVSFSREVMPILSDNCFYCHGPDEKHRKADLRLDTREGALALHDGIAAIVPGDPDKSDLVARVCSTDGEEIMPPPKSNKKLSPAQIDTLRRWVADGAPWGKHWAFEKIERPSVPGNATHPIDAFVGERLRKEGLTPSPEASRATQLRRLSLDLTGLPPSPEEATRFLNDSSPHAWEELTRRLLASPHYGERMAMWWLDAARYSDTDGFQSDSTRDNWPWRDWVVDAFNHNLPFNQFTLEQFAGDLLPNSRPEQTLATCFHRNHMTNGEGGRDPEESRIDYVIDRVNTVGTLWLGLTLGCAQCHSHKFDPVSQAEYYSLTAFFNSIDEDGKAGNAAKPYLSFQSTKVAPALAQAQQLLEDCKRREAAARQAAKLPFKEWLNTRLSQVRDGFQAWHPLLGKAESVEGSILTQSPSGEILASGPNPVQDDYRIIGTISLREITGLKLEIFPAPAGAVGRSDSGHFTLTDIKVQVRRPSTAQVREILIANAIADYSADPKTNSGYGKISDVLDDDPRNGWASFGADPKLPHTAIFALSEALTLAPDEELIFELRHRSTLGNGNIAHFRILATDQAAVHSLEQVPLERLAEAHLTRIDEIPAPLHEALFNQFLATAPLHLSAQSALDSARRQFEETKKAAEPVKVMVLSERPKKRDTHILLRGVWDKKGDLVQAGTPAAIAPWPEATETSRLGLARWLVSRENPLTARVLVNHLWQMFFGAGLVRTPDDFGLQGQHPTHPELLDWLAIELIESNWNLQHVIGLITSSSTYRQSSAVAESLLNRDPENRFLARASRFRLPSWMLRDSALALSGLLNRTLGGPPVRPYQPAGVWEEIFMGRFHYEPSQGPAQYRRTLYAFWRRSAAPTFLFDSAQRRVCEVRIARTNTPLQALTLLNDETFLEASRILAEQLLEKSASPAARITELYCRLLCRIPEPNELAILEQTFAKALAHYRAHPEDAAKFLAQGQSPPNPKLPLDELAAQMLVCSLTLNLDETITHE